MVKILGIFEKARIGWVWPTKKTKLKPLLDKVPPGFVSFTIRFEGAGHRRILHDYVSRGGGAGFQRRVSPSGAEGGSVWSEVSWEIALLSLEADHGEGQHLGGNRAGNGAIPIISVLVVWRASTSTVLCPRGLQRIPTQTKIVVHRRTLLGDDPRHSDAGPSAGTRTGGECVALAHTSVVAERAILEALDELRKGRFRLTWAR